MVAKSTLEIVINGTTKGAEAAFGKVTKAIGTLGKVAIGAGIAGIAALGAGLAYSVKEAMEAQEIQAQLAAVLKSTGGAAGVTADMANELAESLSKVTRFEDDTIVAGENMLLTFTNIGKDVFPRATETILDMSTALGQDLQSSAIQLGKALNNPVEGMTALQRVGVTFTEEQKNMIAALVESGDVMGAQTVILDELQKEFGGSAKAAGETFAGQLDILKNSISNVGENIGMALMPALTTFISEGITPIVNKYGPLLAAWLGENLPKAIKILSDFWTGTLQPALSNVWVFIKDNVIPIIEDIYKWLKDNLPKAIAIAGEWIQKLRDWWAEHGEAIMEKAKEIWDTVTKAINDFVEWAGPKIQEFIDAVNTFWNEHGAEIIATAKEMWDTVTTAQRDYIEWAGPIIEGFLDAVEGFWAEHGDQIKLTVEGLWNGIKELWENFKNAFNTAIDLFHLAQQGDWYEFGVKLREIVDDIWAKIKESAAKAIDAIKQFFTETDWGSVGEGILKGIGNGITAGLQWLKDAARAAAKAALDAAKGFLGIESPSKAFMEVGKNMMQGMALGISGSSGIPALATASAAAQSVSNVYYSYNLSANYGYQSPNSLAQDIRLLELLHS